MLLHTAWASADRSQIREAPFPPRISHLFSSRFVPTPAPGAAVQRTVWDRESSQPEKPFCFRVASCHGPDLQNAGRKGPQPRHSLSGLAACAPSTRPSGCSCRWKPMPTRQYSRPRRRPGPAAVREEGEEDEEEEGAECPPPGSRSLRPRAGRARRRRRKRKAGRMPPAGGGEGGGGRAGGGLGIPLRHQAPAGGGRPRRWQPGGAAPVLGRAAPGGAGRGSASGYGGAPPGPPGRQRLGCSLAGR